MNFEEIRERLIEVIDNMHSSIESLELVKNCTILDVSQCSEKNNEYKNLRAKSDCCNSDMDLHWKDGTICKKCGEDCNYHTVDITKENIG